MATSKSLKTFFIAVVMPATLLRAAPDVPAWTADFAAGAELYGSSHIADSVKTLERAAAAAEGQGASDLDKAKILDSLGAAYEAEGRLEEAKSAFDRALATRRQLLQSPHEALAVSLTNESTIFWAMAKAEEAVTFAEQAKQMWERLNQTGRREYVIAINNLLAAYRLEGHIRDSVPLMNYARTLYVKTLAPTDPILPQSLSSLASAFRDAGDYPMADALAGQAMQLANSQSNVSPALRLHLLATQAEIKMAEGHLPEARKLAEESLSLTVSGTSVSPLQQATELRTLGTVYRLSGDLDRAQEQYRAAMKLVEGRSGQAAIERGTLLNDLALLAELQREWKQAEQLFGEALHTLEAVLGPGHAGLSTTYSNLAGFYEQHHQLGKAAEFYRKAYALDSAALPRVHAAIGRDLNNLGSLAFKLHHYKEAEGRFRDAVDVFQQTVGTSHPNTGLAEANLANSLALLKKTDEARECYSKATAILEQSWGVDDPRLVDMLASYAKFSRDNADMAAAEQIETHLVRIRVKQAIAQEREKGKG